MIIYTLTVNKPDRNVQTFPPSILESDYINNLVKNTNSYGSVSSGDGQLCLFANATELNAWLAANTLTDPTLVSDLNTWKAAHGITFTTRVWEIADATTITVTPVF